MAPAGRPMSELRGRTEEANALATWLRKVTAGVQVRVPAETFPYSKSVWSEYRNGAKLIPQLRHEIDVDDHLKSSLCWHLAWTRRLAQCQQPVRGNVPASRQSGRPKTPRPPTDGTGLERPPSP